MNFDRRVLRKTHRFQLIQRGACTPFCAIDRGRGKPGPYTEPWFMMENAGYPPYLFKTALSTAYGIWNI